jgi:hypothetical protein
MKDRDRAFLVNIGIGLVLCVGVIALNWTQDYVWSRRLCDGFFIAATVLLGCGGILFAAGKGTFDMMGYSIKSVFHLHFSGNKSATEQEDFVAYRQRKDTKRKSPKPMLSAGLLYLILSVLFLLAYLAEIF